MEVGLAVGGALLSSVLNVLFDRMTDTKFLNLFHGRRHDVQLLKKLKTTLIAIRAVLEDAEDKQATNRHVKDWLSDLRGVVYHAEDLVDKINTEVLRVQVEEGLSVSHLSVSLSDEFLKDVIPILEDIVCSLEYFVTQINVLGLERVVSKKDNSYRLPSTSLVNESDVYGREGEKEELIRTILSSDDNGNNVSVIPIVGMCGVGKTTLAQVVYGDERVKKYFDQRAWVCVSEKYDAFKITKTLVGEVTYLDSEDKDDFNLLQIKLKESLDKQRFLVVLDDVWNENYNDWDNLKAPLIYGKRGSKIIVTTRNEKVAFTMQNESVHYLEPLSDEDCWSLFKKHAFDNNRLLASPEFERIGIEIMKKCKGLPLAVKTIGGLLRSKTKIKEWHDILRSEFWTNQPNDVLAILRLSYYHLQPHLKHCFAFCAIFPKNYRFTKEELVLLWMANDLLQHSTRNDKTIEALGLEYFSELRSRSFFQEVSGGKYIMHDLVNDLARDVCGRFCVRYEDCQQSEIPSEARYFSYMPGYYDAYVKFEFLHQVKSLRTFFPVNPEGSSHMLTKMFLSDIFPGLKCLRVLSLCGYDIKELPNSICNLKHLRYLNLSSTYIEQLPDDICSLYNLQTLLLIQCEYLQRLPTDMTKLVSLRHLDLRGTELWEMPSHVSRLKNLQTLSYFIVGCSPGRKIEEMGRLHLYGYLKIMGLENVTSQSEALRANLGNKSHIIDLVLQWSGNTDDSQVEREILDKLQPHTNLKSLTIDGYGGTRFPDWLADDSVCNIVSLHLTNCMHCFSLPTLGYLPSLKSLSISKLNRITKIGQEFYGDGSLVKPFRSLVAFRIEQMFGWEDWDTSGNVEFSVLEELYIKDCPKLTGELPSQLPCLKKIEIFGCSRLVLPDDWMGHPLNNKISSLQFLRISDMPNLKELPQGLLRLGLEELTIRRCHNLLSSPMVTAYINRMVLEDFPSLVSLPAMVPCANIKVLDISNCKKFEFPTGNENDGCYVSLEHLRLQNFGDSISDTSLGLFPKLLTLGIHSCVSFKFFHVPCGIQNLTLHRLEIWDCDDLLSFPRGLAAPNLEFLWVLGCKKLNSLPEQINSLYPSLRELYVAECPEIEYFPGGGLPSSLETLHIILCEKLIRSRRAWDLQRLPALKKFSVSDVYEESFPDDWLLPCSLRVLDIYNHKNLETLNQNGLLCLTSLETLIIFGCPKLRSFPEEGLPFSLSQLEMVKCPLLKPHLNREGGKYWPSVAHISRIVVDYELIS